MPRGDTEGWGGARKGAGGPRNQLVDFLMQTCGLSRSTAYRRIAERPDLGDDKDAWRAANIGLRPRGWLRGYFKRGHPRPYWPAR